MLEVSCWWRNIIRSSNLIGLTLTTSASVKHLGLLFFCWVLTITTCEQANYELLKLAKQIGMQQSCKKTCITTHRTYQDAITYVVSYVEEVDIYCHLHKLETSWNRYIGILMHSPQSVWEYSLRRQVKTQDTSVCLYGKAAASTSYILLVYMT